MGTEFIKIFAALALVAQALIEAHGPALGGEPHFLCAQLPQLAHHAHHPTGAQAAGPVLI